MKILEPLEIDKIESWLDRVELFLMELQATDRAQLILDLNQQVRSQLTESPDLHTEQVLKKMGEPMQVANRVRMERGFKPRKRSQPKSRSIGSFLIFSVLAAVLLFTTCTLSLPFVVPWGLNHLANKLGQQPDGIQSFHIFKGFNSFKPHSDNDSSSDKQDPNDLNSEGPQQESEAEERQSQTPSTDASTNAQENITGSFQSDGISAIHIQAKHTKLNVSSSKSPDIQYDCKISSLGYARPFIRKSPSGMVTLALDQIAESASCEIKIPESIKLEIQTQTGEIQLKQMSQNISLEASEAKVFFSPADGVSFEIEANTKKGEVKGLADFEKKQSLLKSNKKYLAKFSLNAGSIFLGPEPWQK